MNARALLSRSLPYLAALGVAIVSALLLAAIFLTVFDLQWIAFLAGVLVAACIALASRASHSAWTIARRTAQLAQARGKLATEAQLRADAERHARDLRATLSFVDKLPAMISFVDVERLVRYHNKAFAEGLGYPGVNLQGRSLAEVLGAGVCAEIAKKLDEAFAGSVVRYERLQRTADGQPIRLAVQYLPRFGYGGRVLGVFSILTDVTGPLDVAPAARPSTIAAPQPDAAAGASASTPASELTGWDDVAERLRRALGNDDFVLFGQHIAPLSPERAPLREVLLRLREEEEKLMPPGAFLPLAEECGMLADLDGWVARRVIEWVRGDPAGRGGVYSLNVSAETIASQAFIDLVARALRESGEGAPALCFEFGEREALQDPARTVAFMRALRNQGCRFALNGFGRDPVAFKVVKELAFDYVKIDASLVLNLANSDVDLAKLKAINQVAHGLGARTIGVCVESDKVLEALRAAGTDYAQGFAVGKPEPLELEAAVA